MTQISIEHVAVPASLDGPGGADFLAIADLMNTQQREIWGNDDFYGTPQSQLAGRSSTPTRRRLILAARAVESREILGVVQLNLPLTDNLHTGNVNVVVAPDARRQGVGTQLYFAAEQLAAANGRRMLMTETEHLVGVGKADVDPDREDLAGTDTARFIPNDAAASFAAKLGFRLELVDRVSRLDLSDYDGGNALQEQAAAAARAGYELVFWRGACPQDLVGAYAQLRQKMSTDAPQGGLDLAEEAWDEARVREAEAREVEMDYESLVCAARHAGSGELAGHTVLEVFRNNLSVAYQDDTLVLGGHRGHRLGMLMKAANLARLREAVPGAERVYTWNAEENRYMLSINEQLGFRAVGYAGEWQKQLASA
ncbi:GNAT family N-acetyltransferase [Arthrobacter sp. zg-Y750]|uniref:GNAT family N-acetyltransferase n=1 Tax=Arthrobacter sp. zg-Y750 TaxID=2894189 RepID=UPI001E55DFF1|nr:GNAT family N-acetyltransferase [Arthrobacter sp. zg-Y750]MCC9176355.1 GNAT family N-acetyltransferase [Arthrobacter sp. zg-Y750]